MAADSIDPSAVLSAYDLGTVSRTAGAGGTAGRTWKVSTSSGDYFLRLRGGRTSSEARLEFDHGLRTYLVDRGIPTAAVLPTKSGARWLRCEEGVYELYPFVVGRSFAPQRRTELASAAKALAQFHRTAADYHPPSLQREPIAQYTTLRFSQAVSDRMDDPELQKENLLAVGKLATTAAEQALTDRCIARVEQMRRTYGSAVYARLSGWVIHGDYTPANLLFSEEGDVVGIFDLDWALPGARCRDVADGLFFFATQPRQIDSADIWSLTEAAEFDPDRCRIFLQAYQQITPLTAAEIDAIPQAFAGRWISIRLEGMAKVDADERFRFFARDIEKPLCWLDVHWEQLKQQIF